MIIDVKRLYGNGQIIYQLNFLILNFYWLWGRGTVHYRNQSFLNQILSVKIKSIYLYYFYIFKRKNYFTEAVSFA